MLTDDGRMDDLLARTLAHRAVLEILVALALPSDEERVPAYDDAAQAFEGLYAVIPMAKRAQQSVECGLIELEQIFRVPDTHSEDRTRDALVRS